MEKQTGHKSIRFAGVTVVNMQIVVLWVMILCSLNHGCQLTRLHGVINYKIRVRTHTT